jgi:DNA-binding NarL/FixJ family response regulator
VVVADDHHPMRRIMCEVLTGSGIRVLADPAALTPALHAVSRLHPDVLVFALAQRDRSRVDTILELRAMDGFPEIVFATMTGSAALASSILAAGALGYVSKDHADSELPLAVRAAAQGERFVSPVIADLLPPRRGG